MLKMNKFILNLILIILFYQQLSAQSFDRDSTANLNFIVQIPTTPVKNQAVSGTCWSFATLSFLESELLRIEGKEYDLSEMFVVRKAYEQKAVKFVKMHGALNFSGGGEANDVLNVIKKNGIVEEQQYTGLLTGIEAHNHDELDRTLKEYVEHVVLNMNDELANEWLEEFNSILDKKLGKDPSRAFKSSEESSYGLNLSSINVDDYVFITSFNHHPFYSSFILEVPDNWSWWKYTNLPLEELQEVVDSALLNGYSVAWASDYSEKGFLFNEGVAVVPRVLYAPDSKKEVKQLNKLPNEERIAFFSDLDSPVEELIVNQEIRQTAFDNYSTTDDHLMHIVGKVENKEGKQYFLVKNSWGVKGRFDGYFYVSEPYFQYKTISIMLHKEAIPEKIVQKLNM